MGEGGGWKEVGKGHGREEEGAREEKGESGRGSKGMGGE